MSKEETMVERVARAIYAVSPMKVYFDPEGKPKGTPIPWEETAEAVKQRCYAKAIAVIDSLMEPSPEMVEAGRLALAPDTAYVDTAMVRNTYRAMLSKAKEGTGE